MSTPPSVMRTLGNSSSLTCYRLFRFLHKFYSVFFGLLDPDPKFICTDQATDPDLSINKQKNKKKTLNSTFLRFFLCEE
jgi:hypothetical protein